MVGYRAWFYFAEKKSDAAMQLSLDKDQYDEGDLISLTIPLDNPYQLEQMTFERINGEISFQGKTFRYVKRKIINGNLIILCIPDSHKMVLKKAKADYGNIANDLAGNDKSSSRRGTQKNFGGSDYLFQTTDLPTSPRVYSAPEYNSLNIISFSDPHISLPGKPPQHRA